MPTREEAELQQRFRARYGVAPAEATRDLELAVIGGDWGANGYTTMSQAEALGVALGLGPDGLLLDLGAGRGWPGLYLATRSGCRAVLCDLPIDALRSAATRAAAEGLGGRASPVLASARQVPLRAGVFDGVVHTDVLC